LEHFIWLAEPKPCHNALAGELPEEFEVVSQWKVHVTRAWFLKVEPGVDGFLGGVHFEQENWQLARGPRSLPDRSTRARAKFRLKTALQLRLLAFRLAMSADKRT